MIRTTVESAMKLGGGQGQGEMEDEPHSLSCLGSSKFIGNHDYQAHLLAVGTIKAIPCIPNKMGYAKLRRLGGKLAAEGRVGGYYKRDATGFNERWSKDGNGLSRPCGEDGDDVVMFGFEDCIQKESLVLAGKGRVGAARIER